MEKLEALAGQAGVAVMGGHDGMSEGVFDEFDVFVAEDDFVFRLQAHFASSFH